MTCEVRGEEGARVTLMVGDGGVGGGGVGVRQSRNRKETTKRIRRTTDKTKRTTSNEEIGQTIVKPWDARWTCITFPESEAMLGPIVRTNKECHTQDRPVEPKTAEVGRYTRNHANRHTE